MEKPILPLKEGASTAFGEGVLHDAQFKVPFADLDVLTVPEGSLILQSYRTYFCFIELVEVRAERDLFFPYQVTDFAVFLFFMLEGQSKFITEEGQVLSEMGKGTCCVTASASGNQVMHLKKGTHIMAYLSPRVEWLLSYENTWPELIDVVYKTQASGQGTALMQQVAINRVFVKHLIDMWRISEDPNPNKSRNIFWKIWRG